MTKRELLEELKKMGMDDEIVAMDYYDSRFKEFANDIKIEGFEAYRDLRGKWVLSFDIDSHGASYLVDDKGETND